MKNIDAKEFIETMRLVPSWMSLGGRSEKAVKHLKAEFKELGDEAYRAITKRDNFLFYCVAMTVMLFAGCACLLYGIRGLETLGQKVDAARVVCLVFAGIFPLTCVLILLISWGYEVGKPATIKLDDYQKDVYDDIAYLMRPIWMKSKLDWTTKRADEEWAKDAWLNCLRDLALEIEGLERKTALPDYPEKFRDQMQLEESRESLDELFRILRRFKIVAIEKGDLFKEPAEPAPTIG